ncbi:RNA polymerase-associated protein RapA [Tenacibaculum sp. Bg11-29]|uniref:RNA polymerase-associated protein RapA n=1 Tax=Tenacibaculum sp. Bg11-29 TaxID=2058306 RepID=UPI000C338953|nr:RNA polymerase-associated protein RapA [Tenacibaculum sp. Bg11-29]PKH52604.1 RNA polymerase-associated protein RapA [Tenacibaculum sp. Bg11-29]
MTIFFPNQRYTSKGEPELGVGILTNSNKGKIQLYFPTADETRMYALENAPLQRVVFKPGDTIKDTENQPLVIKRVEEEDNLYVYYGKDKKISEAALGDVSVIHGVDDRLFMGDVDTPKAFALRRETLQHEYERRLSPVNGFVGGRIALIPHQLYIAHEVSSRYAPRVLLSDQVGLGKTIEACLILHRLLVSGRISRVLILVPESLVHQWFVEVLRRFNMWFHIFDEERCASLDESAPDGNPFLDNQLIICSTEFLANSAKRTKQALTAGWDMLVVDEAHNLEWSVNKASTEYNIVALLSKVAKGLLLLTATPEQLGVESHFARLRLLDPNRYANYDDFVNESSDHKTIANIIEKLHLGKDLNTKDTTILKSLFPKENLKAITKEKSVAKDNLIENLLDQHGPGRVLFRNTRATMSGFPKRKAHLISLEPTKDKELWMERLSNEFTHEVTPSETTNKQQFWFAKDPRVEWLLTTIKEIHPAKILLICKSKEKVLALEKALVKHANLKTAMFHEDLTIVQRDKNAAWFSEINGAQILLCSEIGSEGRNFQFAHHLILFDLPLHPELLEQRIGRLDRIGQTEDIHIHIPYLANSKQHLLAKWFHKGLNAFENNIEGGNKIAELFGNRLLTLLKAHENTANNSEIKALISETSSFQTALLKNLADGRDRLLEMNSFRPKVAGKLIKQILSEDKDKSLERYLTKVFRHFDIEMEDRPSRTYYLKPTSIITETFPSIPQEGVSVTFNRKHALSREEISFLSWDHPMTTDAIDVVLSSGTGSASYGVLKATKSPGLLLEIIFVLETPTGQNIYVDRFLPNTPVRVVVDHTGKEVTNKYSIELLDKKLSTGQIDPLLDNETLVETLLPNMIKVATEIAEEQRTKEIANGLIRMNRTLKHEIDRLKILQGNNNNIRPEEIETALNEQLGLTSLIKNARIRMDAIQLIRKE